MTSVSAEIGVIGGSGFFSFADDAERVRVPTPYGPSSGDLHVGELAGRRVAFLPRHGADHEHPPQLVNYRANLWALHSLGVRQVLAPSAVSRVEVLATFRANLDRLKQLLVEAVRVLPGAESGKSADCPCRRAVDGLPPPPPGAADA